MINRREMLALGGSLAVLGWAVPGAWGADFKDQFAVSTWSFHNYFEKTRYGKPTFTPDKWWKVEQVVEIVHDQLGLKHFEMSSAHLESLDEKYLGALSEFMAKKGCQFIHMSDNMPGVNLSKNPADLRRFLDLIDVTSKLKIPTMRVNSGDGKLEDAQGLYKALALYAKTKNVEIVIENHFGLSADPKNVEAIIKSVGDNISSCPDFGLFKKDEERWPGLEIMFAHAKRMCSAKFHGFDDKGQARDFDLKRCYDAMKKAKYPGWISFEYEGNLEPIPQLKQMKEKASVWLA